MTLLELAATLPHNHPTVEPLSTLGTNPIHFPCPQDCPVRLVAEWAREKAAACRLLPNQPWWAHGFAVGWQAASHAIARQLVGEPTESSS